MSVGAKDLAHSAAPQTADDAVATGEDGPGSECKRGRGGGTGRDDGGRLVKIADERSSKVVGINHAMRVS